MSSSQRDLRQVVIMRRPLSFPHQPAPRIRRSLIAAVSSMLIAAVGLGCGEKSEPEVSSIGTGATVPTTPAPTAPVPTTTAPAPAPQQ
jgi:hypothetical protein